MKKEKQSLSPMWKRGLRMIAAGALAFSMLPALSASAEETPSWQKKPDVWKAGSVSVRADTVTEGEPFAPYTAGSRYFRIPAMITLENGDLVAAADARWETSSDGGGLDTIASVSSDGGQTWNYSFPMFFPDSDGYAGRAATTIIDPGIVEGPDGTVYCFADVNPTGSTTLYKTIGTGTGYVTVNGKRYLAVTDNYGNVETMPTDTDTATYAYYVDDFDADGYAQILKRADGSATGYGVDEWYNLYSVNDGKYTADLTQKQVNSDKDIQQNIFYKDSKYHVYSIGYIWVVTSKDHGRTWEHPQNINDVVKRTPNEHAILVSPGQGTVTKAGDIILGFYDHGDNQENASLIYSSDNGKTWKRTNDISGGWTSENEIVELEDGTLRMFCRNGSGKVSYADAVKDANGDYTMGSLVHTACSVESGCNVSAISYSKKIDGKQAILVACPGGSGRTNGKIFTFLVEEDNSMTLANTFSVPDSRAGYCYSCLSELEDGSIGLLWEPSHQAILYDRFSMADIVPGKQIENVTKEVYIEKGETYTRTYTGSEEAVITVQPDEKVASVKAEIQIERDRELKNHIAENPSTMDDFAKTAGGQWLSDAEFTLTKQAVEGNDNAYQIYNESAGVYLTNESSAEQFFSAAADNMTIAPTSGSQTFRICRAATSSRYIFFYFDKMRFDTNSSYNAAATNGSFEMALFEKKDTVAETDVIPGYARVSSITSGKKYLITYLWTDGSVIVLYPTNGTGAQTKLVGDEVQSRKKVVSITGTGKGYTKAVVDGTAYRIHVSDGEDPEILDLGEVVNLPNAVSVDAAPADDSVIKVETYDNTKEGMYDHRANVMESLTSFDTNLNTNITLEQAEFTFTASGSNWKIKNESKNVYLANTGAATFFTTAAADMKVTPTSGADTFRICKENGQRYIIFYTTNMDFNANTNYVDNYTAGSYELTLLEKQDAPSADDVISGYKRASSITSGKKYLITYIWENGSVIVLYPENGTANQTKLARLVDRGVNITAMGKGDASVTIDGVTYYYKVADANCQHGDITVQGAIPADCMERGYTGDKVCGRCGVTTERGQEIAATGHEWDEGVITKEVTAEEDGEKVYTCKHDAMHKKVEVISASAYAKLASVYAEVEELLKNSSQYTNESVAELQKAYEAAKAAESGSRVEMYKAAELLSVAKAALSEKTPETILLEKAKEALAAAVGQAKDAYEAGQKEYTAESWKAFAAAYQAAVGAPEDADAEALKALCAELEKTYQGLKKDVTGNEKPGDQTKPDDQTKPEGLQAGDTAVVKGAQYRVLNAEKKTAMLVTGAKNVKKAVVPATVQIKGVTCTVEQIGDRAFRNNKKLQKVTIGKNVTTIGKQSFQNCKKLKNVIVKGTKLKTIKSGAFKKTAAKMKVKAKKMNKKQRAALLKKMKKRGMSKKAKIS